MMFGRDKEQKEAVSRLLRKTALALDEDDSYLYVDVEQEYGVAVDEPITTRIDIEVQGKTGVDLGEEIREVSNDG